MQIELLTIRNKKKKNYIEIKKVFFLVQFCKHLKGIFVVFFKTTCLKNKEIHSITNERKTAKNEWENDNSDFFRALCSVYKKLGQFFFHTFSLT